MLLLTLTCNAPPTLTCIFSGPDSFHFLFMFHYFIKHASYHWLQIVWTRTGEPTATHTSSLPGVGGPLSIGIRVWCWLRISHRWEKVFLRNIFLECTRESGGKSWIWSHRGQKWSIVRRSKTCVQCCREAKSSVAIMASTGLGRVKVLWRAVGLVPEAEAPLFSYSLWLVSPSVVLTYILGWSCWVVVDDCVFPVSLA